MSRELEYLRTMIKKEIPGSYMKCIARPGVKAKHRYSGLVTTVHLVQFMGNSTEILVQSNVGFEGRHGDRNWELEDDRQYLWDFLYNYEIIRPNCPMVYKEDNHGHHDMA